MEEGRDKDGKFTKGNLFSVGNFGGQPPKYKTPQELAEKIAEYLEWEDQWKNKSQKGEGKGLYTIEGCALFLGFASKASLDDQAKRDAEFSNVIERFKSFMIHWNTQKIYWAGTMPGAKFWLTNWGGYKDERHEKSDSTIHVAQLNVELGS